MAYDSGASAPGPILRKGKPPAGMTEHEFLTEALERWVEATDADRANRDAALEDLEFFVGKQWNDGDLSCRKGRPSLVINRLPQFVTQIVGDMRINKPAIRVRPGEDSDKKLADTREGLIRFIERQSRAASVYANAGQQQVVCGIGNWRVMLDYSDDDGFNQDIFIRRIPNPLSVVWDPFIMDETGRDARYVFVQDDMPRKAYEKAWPNEPPSDLSVGPTLQAWNTRNSVKVVEYWCVKDRPCRYAMLDDHSVVELTAENEAETLPKVARNASGEQMIRSGKRRSVCMWLITAHAILAGPYELPISRVPVIRIPGWEVDVGDRRERWGLVRFAKDPQRFLNYQRSASVEAIGMAPKAKFMGPAKTFEGYEEAWRTAHTTTDSLLVWNDEASVPPIPVPPPQIPAAVIQDAAMHAQDLKDVTGLHDASLGARSNETSGKAILARQKEGDVASFIYHDNLHAGITETGRLCNELIPLCYDTARTVRIVGEDETTKPQRINDPMHPESVDILQGKFDIAIEVGPSYSTKRAEAAESMLAFIQAVPGAAAVTGDLVAKSQDWPMADSFAERLKKTLSPNLLKGEEGEEPPQPDPAQIAQMQAAQAAQQAELELKQAQTRKANADALRAKADADKAAAQAKQEQIKAAAMSGDLEQVAKLMAAAHIIQAAGASAQAQGVQPIAEPQEDLSDGDAPIPDQSATGEGPPSP